MIAYLNNQKLRNVNFNKIITSTPEVETVVVEKIAGYPSIEELANEYLSDDRKYQWSDSYFLIVPSGQYVCTQEWQNVYFNSDSYNWEAQKRTDGSDYYSYNLNNIEEARNYLIFSGETYKMLCDTSDVATNEWGKHEATEINNLNLNTLEETDISGNVNSYLVDYNHNYNIYEKDEWGNENQKSFYNPYNYNEYSSFYAAYKEDKRYCKSLYLSDLTYKEDVDKIEYANIIWNDDNYGAYELDGDTLKLTHTRTKYAYGRIRVKKYANVICNNTLVKNIIYLPVNYINSLNNRFDLYPCVFASGFDEITIQNPDTPLTTASQMFGGCSGLTSVKNLDKLDTSNVTDMGRMFYDCRSLTSLDLSNFDTSNVTNMSSMFENCSGLTSLDLSNWRTSNVTDMSYMLYNCTKLRKINLGNFDTTSITNIHNMFVQCQELRNLIWNNMANGENVTDLRFGQSMYLGDGDSLDDLKNTFVYNSFDRANAGYAACTLQLFSGTVSKFSDEEIAQITNKGYTIA